MRQIALFLVLFLFWILLSGEVDLGKTHPRYLLGCGVVSCAFAVWVASRVGFLYDEGDLGSIVLRQPAYICWLLGQILVSNIDVARRVWSPRLDISPEWLRIPYETHSDLSTVIFANSITLTPGTVTVLVDEGRREILVHALTSGKRESLMAMEQRVRALEGRA